MKNQSKFRTLTLVGVFALLTLSLSSCVYSSRPVRYYDRPAVVHRPYYRVQPRTRVVVVPKYNRHHHHRDYDRRYRNNSRHHRGRY
ncbi:hypothetical protein EWM59_06195 [Emticicia agri]|uniref:Lipoprotein n=2 Tax=Emticicia agri TaxID=2492393 RepID=A0A4Q5M280_9BACT|nr:hypothetical protein EWM59_06195 [Emticicia agri]